MAPRARIVDPRRRAGLAARIHRPERGQSVLGGGHHIPHALDLCAAQGLQIEPCETSYFLSRETVVPTPRPGMALWREHLFALMSRNAATIAEFLRSPSSSVIELGTRVCI